MRNVFVGYTNTMQTSRSAFLNGEGTNTPRWLTRQSHFYCLASALDRQELRGLLGVRQAKVTGVTLGETLPVCAGVLQHAVSWVSRQDGHESRRYERLHSWQ